MYRYSNQKYDVESLHSFPIETFKNARVEPVTPPKAPLYAYFSNFILTLACIFFLALFSITWLSRFYSVISYVIIILIFYCSEDMLLGILEFFRECPFILKIISTIFGVFVIVSVAYKMSTNKEKKKKSSSKRSKNK